MTRKIIMKFAGKRSLLISMLCVAALIINGCSNAPEVSNQPAANQPIASTKPSPVAPPPPMSQSGASQGDPIDTTKHDAEIERAEKELKKKPNDAAARMSLAKAYHARASALTAARQYRPALGDYRRTLRYDPDNADAREMSATIIGILRTIKREVPAEGEEPPPLPFKKDEKKPEDNSQKKSY
ncbi:MAG: hypothetical protein H7Y30_06075 [Pyrinomonadaceae bacterium]|nr:hypothetical protein [Pyrinomonadaceae bacterium]